MRINKDLAEACMMLAFIILVLAGTSDFESETQKHIVMGIFGLITFVSLIFRVLGARQHKDNEDETYGYNP